jgi:ABC-type phosphate/phosphonate transport system substrate-binding protein
MAQVQTQPTIVGAVLYDPKVSLIWDIIRDYFEQNACPIDVVYYTNYELQARALAGGHIDIAWNSPLAWLESLRLTEGRCAAIAMRDTDRDRTTHLVVRRESEIATVPELRGRTLAVGAKDSPQATLIPLGFLQRQGLEPRRDVQVRRFDVLVGKHGDHVGGERQAFECLAAGEADAATMLDLNWESWTKDGTIDPNQYQILASTDRFDHCVFTTRPELDEARQQAWLSVLFSMRYDNPAHREMMDLEGLQVWLPGRTSGFGPLTEAVERQGFFASIGW